MDTITLAQGGAHPSPHVRQRRSLRPAQPVAVAVGVVVAIGLALIATKGLHDVAQTALNGLSFGAVVALGAVGLTLVFGILKLVNFAHGDFLTFGAYIAFAANVSLGLPLVVSVLAAMALTAVLGIVLERVMWGPTRERGAGMLQLLLMSIGAAFVIRYGIQFFAGTDVKSLDVDRTGVVELAGLRIGSTALIAGVTGIVVVVAIGLLLRFTLLGKRMRAVADNRELAETTGIDTRRVIVTTWLFAGATAGLAGVLFALTTNVKPELGYELLLPIFAAVILGSVGHAFGALVAGLLLGVVTEWSTLLVPANWKLSVGFLALILALIVRPQGLFSSGRSS
ncbi:branched-chain amino acid ABC transporter permease [Conexibacter woesei]|uniref:Inner-membrane translocator n=1 Tax=Conexibacter woesei (strain DSM 14684 / CCUG 47730 / CIP 108061 / JCM 11494 / NBRC 100937 / ID131577) TaxID=469383 RepID=D3F9C5_CONWI|nr:branched-chain amino acid ABC transporter permease [Conexibacter woesei]ADB49092.1 inner-membrane translocator [Conexibacter woesei DSM 14684]